MNTSKNSYVIIYMIVIVVVVSLLLSITSGALHSRQEDNVRLDTKKQILMSLSTYDAEQEIKIYEDATAADTYAQTIKGYWFIDQEGNVVEELDPVADFDRKPADGQLAIYVAELDGETKFILPLAGAGLWGPIRTYVALNEDRNTVYGVYFGHEGETPGLGANIVTPKFRRQFPGRHIMDQEGKLVSIAVMKKGTVDNGREQVDAISGGTITSKGVEAMFLSGLTAYNAWLTAKAEAVPCDTAAQEPIVEPNEGGNE